MAEIILPPEEETPQTPELNIDKPTENSKVITIEFEAKKTNKVSTKDTNQQLYTTDTDAWFEFKETSLEGANGTYSVVFRNRHDGSIFQRTGDVVNGVAYYKIPHQEIRHAGAWRGQIVYTLSNGDTTAREFDYDVKGHILDGKDVREIVVEDFETLMLQLRSMKDNAESELASLKQELENITDTAEQNETDRQAFFDDLVEDIDDLQANYQELLDTGVLQTNINTKLEALEEEYAPKLTEVTAQVAQKAQQSALEAEKERINNLISLPEGSTTNDARLEDIKIGYDGKVYDSPGDAVRNQLIEKANQTDVIFPVKNELENYNFASGELTPWVVVNGNAEFGGHGVKVTWNGSLTYTLLRHFYTFTVGRKYYLSFKGAVFNASVGAKFLRTYTSNSFKENIVNISANVTFPNQESYLFEPSVNANNFSFGILDPQSGENFSISEVFLIDLTELFGVGNEPTKEEFEVYLSHIPDGWINRVVSNKEVTRYLFDTLTKGTSDILSDLEEIKQSIVDIVGEQHDN